jgi:predicted AAA+ superfamily ATPase
VRKIENALSNRKTREQVLDSKDTVFCGSARRELSIQKGITHPIRCEIDSKPIDRPRQDSISLVLGPSGSGKTTYCVKEHGKLASRSGDDGTCEFRVYMYANDLDTKYPKRWLKEILLENIRAALSLDSDADVTRLSMTLYAIIDEAGCNEFFCKLTNLVLLKEAVEEIATDCQLVVVSGTGLDFLTNSIGGFKGRTIRRMVLLVVLCSNMRSTDKDDSRNGCLCDECFEV